MSSKSDCSPKNRRVRPWSGAAPFCRTLAGAMAGTLLFAAAFASDSAAETLGFTLENDTGDTIVTVHVSPDWKRDWGADQLQGGPIDPGDSRFIGVIQEDGYCYFDVMIRSSTDESHTYWFIDVCENQTVLHRE